MDTEVKDKTTSEIDIKKPSRYQVILYNDEQTPMEFVIELLKTVYNHTQDHAQDITLSIHNDGKGVAGIYYYEVAEQKVQESILISRSAGYPLSLDIEEL
jgi:ATP-dependent Clp protease adaptor protein ClpS